MNEKTEYQGVKAAERKKEFEMDKDFVERHFTVLLGLLRGINRGINSIRIMIIIVLTCSVLGGCFLFLIS